MTAFLLSARFHGEIDGIGEVGYYDELFFFFIAMTLLAVVAMSWFFVQADAEEE